MRRTLKWAVRIGSLAIVLLLVFGAYVAIVAGAFTVPGVSGALQAESTPPSQEAIEIAATVERRVEEEVADKSGFSLTMTEEELTAIAATRLDPEGRIRDIKVDIGEDDIRVSGKLNGVVPVPVTAVIELTLDHGDLQVALKGVDLGAFPFPGAARDRIQPLLDHAMDLNEMLRTDAAPHIQRVIMESGEATVVGVKRNGETVSDAAHAALDEAFAALGDRVAPAAPGGDIVPPGGVVSSDGPDIYMALGDSLAQSVGVDRPQDGYVSRFHAFLERQSGRELGLVNLGVSGESSLSIFEEQLPAALTELRRRRDDGDPDTRVSVLSLDLGGNDFLAHLGSRDCQSNPFGAACQRRVDPALEAFEENFGEIVRSLADALEPDAGFYVMTVYNPFDFGLNTPISRKSNEVTTRLNGIIREKAEANGAVVADGFDVMRGKAHAWTHMLSRDIHPKASGYQALAYSLAQAVSAD